MFWHTWKFHLRPFFIIAHINNHNNDISSTGKHFADNPSLSSVVGNVDVNKVYSNNDLEKISRWAFQWKMSFNPDIARQIMNSSPINLVRLQYNAASTVSVVILGTSKTKLYKK